jgi:hypothetical protein
MHPALGQAVDSRECPIDNRMRHPGSKKQIAAMDHKIHLAVEGWLQCRLEIAEKVVASSSTRDPGPNGEIKTQMCIREEKYADRFGYTHPLH